MCGQCPQETLLHRWHGFGTNQAPTIGCNHVEGANLTLGNANARGHFRIKEAKLIQRRAPFAAYTVSLIVAKFYDAMFTKQTAESNLLFPPS